MSSTEQQRVVDLFLAALNTGDVHGLMDVLAPDVVAVADGGGLVPAAKKPVHGAKKLAALLSGAVTRMSGRLVATSAWINGAPGVRLDLDGEVATAVSVTVESGQITRIYAIANPDKLERIDVEAGIAR